MGRGGGLWRAQHRRKWVRGLSDCAGVPSHPNVPESSRVVQHLFIVGRGRSKAPASLVPSPPIAHPVSVPQWRHLLPSPPTRAAQAPRPGWLRCGLSHGLWRRPTPRAARRPQGLTMRLRQTRRRLRRGRCWRQQRQGRRRLLLRATLHNRLPIPQSERQYAGDTKRK